MTTRLGTGRRWLGDRFGNRFTLGLTLVGLVAVVVGACATDDGPARSTGSTGVGVGGSAGGTGSGGTATGACDVDERRECKVQIDENNCFVGEQECVDGEWGPCVDPEMLDSLSMGTFTNCTSNPCNPWCQQFGDETPPSPIEAAGTPGPAGGPIGGLPSNWQNAGVSEPCDGAEDCQFDTYCDLVMASGTYQQCVPWPYPNWDNANMAVDLTAPVQCSDTAVTICNRGNVAVPNGTDILIGTFSASTGDFGTCVPTSMNQGNCTWSNGIVAGQCVSVPCAMSGTTNIYVNYDNPMGTAVAESDCDNNWSVYHPSTGCSCTNASSTGSLQQVNMYLLLDDSGSMATNNSWVPAVDALVAWLGNASAASIAVQFKTFDDPDGDCDSDSRGGTCNSDYPNAVAACETPLFALDLLSNTTHRDNIVNWLNAAPSPSGTATPHSAALDGATNVVAGWGITYPTHKNVLVYITDGGGDNCGFTNAAVAALVAGIETYVIVFPGGSVSLCNSIASTGGTGSAIDLTALSGAALEAGFVAAMQAIQAQVSSCTIAIPNPGTVDFNNLTVTWTPTVGMAIDLVEVTDALACAAMPAAGVMEYYLTPVGSPTDLNLCDPACQDVQGDVTSTISILGQCIGGYTQNIHGPIPYAADCTGIGSGQPLWDFLTYDTTQVGDSTIVFQVRTGNDAAEASMGPWTTVATADLANPDAVGGSPIDLQAALGPLAQQSNLEMQFILNPTTNGSATPQLIDWALQYSCLDNE